MRQNNIVRFMFQKHNSGQREEEDAEREAGDKEAGKTSIAND